jgi:arylsulfatase
MKVFILLSFISFSFYFADQRPNVIVVLTDDQGYGELSYHGNPVLNTPHLDKLAEESIRFEDFHAQPMCAPTRAQLLTGLDAIKTGTINVSSGLALLNPDINTMADIFSENNYVTGLFGKWHLGDNYPFRPEDRGFHETVWFPSSHIGSVPDFWGNDYFDDIYIHNGNREQYKGYCTDIFFSEAIKFIEKSVNNDKNFFIYISTNTPHSPLVAKEEDIEVVEADYQNSILATKELKNKSNLIKYLAMVKNIDDNLGHLRRYLDSKNLSENTILLFLTDNGSTRGPSYFNAGMRGKKTQLWEGGHRVPLFIHYPMGGFTEPRDVYGLIQVQDILPTLIEACNLKYDRMGSFDGISFVPQLKSNINAPEERVIVINYSRMPMGFDYPSPFSSAKMIKDKSAVLWKRWRLLE